MFILNLVDSDMAIEAVVVEAIFKVLHLLAYKHCIHSCVVNHFTIVQGLCNIHRNKPHSFISASVDGARLHSEFLHCMKSWP